MESATVGKLGPGDSGGRTRLAAVVLARVAAASATEREIVHDLQPYLRGGPFAGKARDEIASLVTALTAAGLISRNGPSIAATGAGQAAATTFLGIDGAVGIPAWPLVRDGYLVLTALGARPVGATALKAVQRADGLRAAIVASAWKLRTGARPTAAQIRAKLALIALERAFGNGIKGELSSKTALSPKASRMLAAQLARKPKHFATDQRLIAQLAVDAVATTKGDVESLRTGVIHRFLADELQSPARPVDKGEPKEETPAASRQAMEPRKDAAPPFAPAAVPDGPSPPQRPASATASSLARQPHAPGSPAAFVAAVKAAARSKAEGWTGNRRAFVSHVWSAFSEANPSWAVGMAQFKSLLAEAHRLGVISLVTADLRNKQTIADIEASAITWKNTTWHYVRVED